MLLSCDHVTTGDDDGGQSGGGVVTFSVAANGE